MIYIETDRTGNIPLTIQIYRSIREKVRNGEILPGTKLPSSRELAKELSVARNVVIESYEQLIAEGYAHTVYGSGTYICEDLQFYPCEESLQNALTRMDESIGKKEKDKENIICFRTGIPDLKQIPIKKWAQIYHHVALDSTSESMDYQGAEGCYALRVEISRYLNQVRGMMTSPENIVITNGAAQAFDLLCRTIRTSDVVWIENPVSKGLYDTLFHNGVRIESIDVDGQGIQIADRKSSVPKYIFTTPGHQFPTGEVLPLKRRLELIKYAKENQAYIIEDDYDSEFRFEGAPLQTLSFLSPERVIYVGTFSKTLMPSVRIGYMVVPDAIRQSILEEKYVSDIHSNILEQLTMADFLRDGHYERHINHMKKLYKMKRNEIIRCLYLYFGEKVKIHGANVGLHFIAEFSDIYFDAHLMERIRNAEIQITSMDEYDRKKEESGDTCHVLVFGYGNVVFERIEEGIKRLAEIILDDNPAGL